MSMAATKKYRAVFHLSDGLTKPLRVERVVLARDATHADELAWKEADAMIREMNGRGDDRECACRYMSVKPMFEVNEMFARINPTGVPKAMPLTVTRWQRFCRFVRDLRINLRTPKGKTK